MCVCMFICIYMHVAIYAKDVSLGNGAVAALHMRAVIENHRLSSVDWMTVRTP